MWKLSDERKGRKSKRITAWWALPRLWRERDRLEVPFGGNGQTFHRQA